MPHTVRQIPGARVYWLKPTLSRHCGTLTYVCRTRCADHAGRVFLWDVGCVYVREADSLLRAEFRGTGPAFTDKDCSTLAEARALVEASLHAPAEPDPVHAAIDTVQVAEAVLTAALVDLDENDPAQMRRADEAADRSGDARNALSRIVPSTAQGLLALVEFHAADVLQHEPGTFAALAVRDIAQAIAALLPASLAPPEMLASNHQAAFHAPTA